MKLTEEKKIAIIGLGYVGLPLAIEFSKKYRVLGFDTDKSRIDELKLGRDRTNEANLIDLNKSLRLSIESSHLGLILSSSCEDLISCNIYIITVPTPIDDFKRPDLRLLLKASEMVGKVIKKGDIVIYESTVYPGCTEEDCVPVMEKYSGLKYNSDFFCGYSPERINPGDKINTLTNIKKVTSGSTKEIAIVVDLLYQSIITAGTYLASSIKVAEASKAIENAQRDLNISFVNELALIFDRMGIDTNEVLDAASTKWNFLKFKPGLVGGHCIGVDPYYLVHKSISLGYNPEVILSGRKVNDNMGFFIANCVVKLMIKKGKTIKGSKALILGFTFKENCSDFRNTRVIDIYKELVDYNISVDIFDPLVDKNLVKKEYNLELVNEIDYLGYDAVIIAVSHQSFLYLDYQKFKQNGSILYDAKAIVDPQIVDARL